MATRPRSQSTTPKPTSTSTTTAPRFNFGAEEHWTSSSRDGSFSPSTLSATSPPPSATFSPTLFNTTMFATQTPVVAPPPPQSAIGQDLDAAAAATSTNMKDIQLPMTLNSSSNVAQLPNTTASEEAHAHLQPPAAPHLSTGASVSAPASLVSSAPTYAPSAYPITTDFYSASTGPLHAGQSSSQANIISFGGSGSSGAHNINPYATPRSMSIQSLVSSTANSSSLPDDDALSVVSQTTTRNTEEDDDRLAGIEDPDVLLAAEALGDLRADFVSSPKSSSAGSPVLAAEQQQESMMEMIQGQNTLLGTAVRVGRRAYRGGKSYSPRFKYGAEFVERATAPMTTLASYAARTTGVESVLRRNLESRRLSSSTPSTTSTSTSTSTPAHSQPSSSTSSHATKRRKTTFEDTPHSHPQHTRHASTSFANNAMEVDAESDSDHQTLTHKPATDVISLNWQRRLMLSTAGVGVAFSEESLKSLKYCLAWLRWANDHLDKVIIALRSVLGEYDSGKLKRRGTGKGSSEDSAELTAEDEERSIVLQRQIDGLRRDVVGTLKRVVDVVSTYAGSSLPENARIVVKACITNLPRRWALAAKDDGKAAGTAGTTNGTGTEADKSAVVVRQEEAGKKVLVLAREGLEMLHQVSSIVQLTLQRAEEWCERLGRKRPEEEDYGVVGWEMDGVEGGPSGAPAALTVGAESRKDV